MRIAREISSLNLDRTQVIGLVPTMGAFHRGHLQLMKRAREKCDLLVVSLFVNPTQFGEGEDFERYPRNEARDFELAEREGVDVIFTPSVEEMYGSGIRNPEPSDSTSPPDPSNPPNRTNPPNPAALTTIHVAEISERWEGSFRPGHFAGVATVVAKLFNIVRPNFAIFGAKDFQQCRVIERMVADLNMPLDLIFAPTVREPDGLAMSSRNAYLAQELRQTAPLLHKQLLALSESIPSAGSGTAVQDLLNQAVTALSSAGFNVDYLELVDSSSLEPVRSCESSARLIVAARLGSTRLIDNVAVL